MVIVPRHRQTNPIDLTPRSSSFELTNYFKISVQKQIQWLSMAIKIIATAINVEDHTTHVTKWNRANGYSPRHQLNHFQRTDHGVMPTYRQAT
jgi:hypothetical protein